MEGCTAEETKSSRTMLRENALPVEAAGTIDSQESILKLKSILLNDSIQLKESFK